MFKFICKRTIREHQDTKMEMIGGLVSLNSDIRPELSNTRILAAISWAAFCASRTGETWPRQPMKWLLWKNHKNHLFPYKIDEKADLFSLFKNYYDYRIMLNVNANSISPVPVLERYHPSLDSFYSLSFPFVWVSLLDSRAE